MEHFNEAFAQVQKTFHCPTCGKSYQKSDIKMKGFLNNTYIFRATCDRGHQLTIAECVIFMEKQKVKSMSKQDITEIQQEISAFDGNFEKLFNQKEDDRKF